MSDKSMKIKVTLGKGESYSAVTVWQENEVLWCAHNDDPEYEVLVSIHETIEQLTKERDEMFELLASLNIVDDDHNGGDVCWPEFDQKELNKVLDRLSTTHKGEATKSKSTLEEGVTHEDN